MNAIQKTLGVLLLLLAREGLAQKLNVGITFQYHVLKQIKVDSDVIMGSNSYSIYYVKDNRWKFFSAGQSIVIGTILQLDYKRFYAVIEPSYNLNTYNYTVEYPVAPARNERLNFQSLLFQVDVPVYLGFQFKSSTFVRYSFFAGGVVVKPYAVNYQLRSRQTANPQYEYFHSGDMRNVLYDAKPYFNTLVGFGLHFASLGKIDLRYQHRIGSPGNVYSVTFNTVGVGITYYLPLDLKKKKIYYED
jgi:hypothetical protein